MEAFGKGEAQEALELFQEALSLRPTEACSPSAYFCHMALPLLERGCALGLVLQPGAEIEGSATCQALIICSNI